MARKTRYGTTEFHRDIGAFLGDVKLAAKLWQFIRRQMMLQLLSANEVHLDSIGRFFFKFRPGRVGPTGNWTSERLIIKFKAADSLAGKFAFAQSRGHGKTLLEKFKKAPRIRNSALDYKRVEVRKLNAVERNIISARLKSASQSSLQECSDPPNIRQSIGQAAGNSTHNRLHSRKIPDTGTSSDQKSGSENTSASS